MLTSRIGKTVKYKPPRDMGRSGKSGKTGMIVDEVWADERLHTKSRHAKSCQRRKKTFGCWGDYSFCAQLIRWDHGEHSIRLAYYRRRCGEDHWEYASQMTVDAYWPTLKRLVQRTLAKKEWFRDRPRTHKLPAISKRRVGKGA